MKLNVTYFNINLSSFLFSFKKGLKKRKIMYSNSRVHIFSTCVLQDFAHLAAFCINLSQIETHCFKLIE